MRVFITGGTGFIGRRVAALLAARGHELRCLARATSRTMALDQLGAAIVRGDLADRYVLREAMRDCDWAIHLAAAYEFWLPDRAAYRRINVDGARNVCECAVEAGIAKLVFVSTIGVWGRPAESPVTETTAPGPERFGAYFETKHQGEQIAWELHRSRGLPLVVVYPGGVLGPSDPKATGEYFQRLVRRRLPARIFERSPFAFVHVADVAEGIVRAAEKEGNVGERYILARHNPTFGEINALVREESGVPLPWLSLPDGLALLTARILTGVANVTRRPPLWGLALDQALTMRAGFVADGSKAERELGLAYTPLRACVRDAVQSLL